MQDVPPECFADLQLGDILFIDHRTLPRLAVMSTTCFSEYCLSSLTAEHMHSWVFSGVSDLGAQHIINLTFKPVSQ